MLLFLFLFHVCVARRVLHLRKRSWLFRRRHTYPYPFLFENRNFFFVFKMKKKIINRVHSWIIFAFPLGRKRKSDRKFYHLWWERAHLVEPKSAISSLAITLDPTPRRNRFQKPPFTSIHTSKAKRPRFQKSASWRSFVKRSVVSVLELTGYVRTVGKQGGKKISSSDKYKVIPGSCLMRLLLILCTSVCVQNCNCF